MLNKTGAVIEMAILLVIAGTVQAGPTFINTCPFVITSPGDYLLSADLICSPGGIIINSSNVTLKLERHRITAGAGATVAIGVAPNPLPGVVQNVHILGPGLITRGATYGFTTAAVYFSFATNSEVSGITVRGSIGVEVDNSDFVTITANTLGQNSGPGIYLANASATISENNVSGGDGIFINDQRGIAVTTTVSHNFLNGNSTGVFISGVGVTVENNVTNGNQSYGIYVAKPPPGLINDVHVTDNTSLANGESQLSVAPFDLFNESPDCSLGVTWSGNKFFTANQTCIH